MELINTIHPKSNSKPTIGLANNEGIYNRKQLKKILKKESKLVAKNSMEILKEFEQFEY